MLLIHHPSTLLKALMALATLVAAGVTGYMLIVGMSFSDALFMTVTTVTTVGYREVQPLGEGGRFFTIVLIFCGLGIVFYTVGLVARDFIEGEIQRTFGRRKVERKIEQLSGHYIVCGFGRMGRIICKELAVKPVPFVVVERDPETLRHLEAEGYLHVAGDATEDAVLLQAGIKRAQGLISALSTDSDNVYVVLTARELKSDLLIVARAADDRGERKLLHAGASKVISPYVIGGHRMAQALLRPAVLDVIDLATHYRNLELQIEEIPISVGGYAAGAVLQAENSSGEANLILIALKKPNGETVFNPDGGMPVQAGDRLVVMGQADGLRALERRLGPA